MLNIIQHRKIYFFVSGSFVLLSIVGLLIWGLNLGIDFTGGSLLELDYSVDRPKNSEIVSALSTLDLGEINVQQIGESGVILRFKNVDEDTHQEILRILNNRIEPQVKETTNLKDNQLSQQEKEESQDIENNQGSDLEIKTVEGEGEAIIDSGDREAGDDAALVNVDEKETKKLIEERRFESIGPTIGKELKQKALYAIIVVLIAIVAYIAWAFRKVSKPITSWRYGVIAIITLIHDVLIVIGIYVFLGKFLGIEVNTPFVAALLTILGYSVNDTIVVFDRIRENLPRREGEFSEIINFSVNETITRSINTSLTTFLVLLAIFFFGGSTIQFFVLALICGVVVGTYSSIFIASPLLVVWENWTRRSR